MIPLERQIIKYEHSNSNCNIIKRNKRKDSSELNDYDQDSNTIISMKEIIKLNLNDFQNINLICLVFVLHSSFLYNQLNHALDLA